ncbi:MAG TPA: hypothetical protein VMV91_15720, partial [Rhodocyclaceae bacterium]|nr:hypothetical protein [Rhodocyclaceae bacterium]
RPTGTSSGRHRDCRGLRPRSDGSVAIQIATAFGLATTQRRVHGKSRRGVAIYRLLILRACGIASLRSQ